MKFEAKDKTWTMTRAELLAFIDCTNLNAKLACQVVVFELHTGMVWATDGVRALIFDPNGTARENMKIEDAMPMAVHRSVLYGASLFDEIVFDPRSASISLYGVSENPSDPKQRRADPGPSMHVGSVPYVHTSVKLPLIRGLLIQSAEQKARAKTALPQRNPKFDPSLLSPLMRLDRALGFELHVGDDVRDPIELVRKPWIFVFMPMDTNPSTAKGSRR